MFPVEDGNPTSTAEKEQTESAVIMGEQAGSDVRQTSKAPRKRTKESELFSAAIKMSVDGIIIGDLYGYITDVNDAVVRMCGAADKSEFVGKHIVDFLVKEDRPQAVKDSMDSIRLGQGRTSEYRALSRNVM